MCPICGDLDCYRQIPCYWRYAIELFPQLQKKRIPVARFVCRKKGITLSLLPIQLIPYFQYTVSAVMGTLLLGLGCWHRGQQGFFGASVAVHPDSYVTPWLVVCWLAAALRGFRRAHAVLGRLYDLSGIRTVGGTVAWEEVRGYFLAFGWKPETRWGPLVRTLLHRYSRTTRQFLFGRTSQQRALIRH